MISDYDREHIEEIMGGHGDWFTAQLLRLCAKADANNLERIRRGFPDVVLLFQMWYYAMSETNSHD
jgi:hypothetical protein